MSAGPRSAATKVKAPLLWRKVHYWTSLPLMLTILVIAVTGILLSVKKDFDSLQPQTRQGSSIGHLQRSVADLVTAVASVPGHAGATADDVDRIDIRPGDGVAKVILRSRTEVQVDLATGKVLSVAYRTSDWLETIHDFSFIGGWSKYVFSTGSGLLLLGMAGSGIYLFLLPFLVRRRKRRAKG